MPLIYFETNKLPRKKDDKYSNEKNIKNNNIIEKTIVYTIKISPANPYEVLVNDRQFKKGTVTFSMLMIITSFFLKK